MKKHIYRSRILLVLILLTVFVLNAGDVQTSLIQAYEKQIASQKNMIEKLTKENVELKVKVGNLQTSYIDNLISEEPIKLCREKGSCDPNNFYERDPEHLKNCWKLSNKYLYLLTSESIQVCKQSNIDPVIFCYCWMFKESGYNPNAEYHNENKTIDWGISQINDCVWDTLYKRLPIKLKEIKNPKRNSEVGVAMLYLWINDRTANRWPWAYLSNDGWILYSRIGELKCMQN